MTQVGWLELHGDDCTVKWVDRNEVRSRRVPLGEVSGWDPDAPSSADLRLVEVLTDGEVTLVEAGPSLGRPAATVKLQAKGSGSSQAWQYTAPGSSKPAQFLTTEFLTALALDATDDELKRLHSALARPNSPFTAWCVLDEDGHDRLTFEADAGMAAVVQDELARLREKQQRRHEATMARERDDYWERVRAEGFVMPYNFVPLPPEGTVESQRSRSASHAFMVQGLVSGRIDFTASALTPLLLRGYEKDNDIHAPRTDSDGRVVVRGSSLKGSLRSVFEPLTGSCLAILDTETRPVYRDPAAARPGSWRLAVVSKHGKPVGEPDARPLAVSVCSEVVWVPEDDMRAAVGVPETGQRFDLTGGRRTTDRHQRTVIADGDWQRSPSGAWVILVTDTHARDRQHPDWYWAMGRIDETNTRDVSLEAWQDFTAAVADSDDSRRSRTQGPPAATLPATGSRADQPRIIGRRLPALRTTPQVGVPLWVRETGQTVDRIALSYLWRTHSDADGPDRRVAPDHLRCKDANRACPACQVFGMVADERAEATSGSSARAHVDSFALRSVEAVDASTLPVTPLPAMGAPKSGSGQMYLQLRDNLAPAALWQRPLYEWGSAADRTADGKPTQLRGRKFYWNSAPLAARGIGRERYSRHTNDRQGADNMLSSAKLVPAGTRFAGSLKFSNLTEAQLGALLAVLQPSLIWGGDGGTFAWSLGGGKPLGLGAMSTESISLTVTTRERYESLAGDGETSCDDEAFRRYVAAFIAAAPQGLAETSWPALRNLLKVDHVPGDVIDYPVQPGRDDLDPRRNGRHYLGLAPGFAFWRRTKGHQPNPMVLLPKATDRSIAQRFDGPVIRFGEE